MFRTVVPAGVGFVLTLLARKLGVVIDTDTSTSLTAALVVVVTAIYYGVVRVLELKFPWLGILLGWKAQPTYDGKSTSGKL
jgi:hypothetical protein